MNKETDAFFKDITFRPHATPSPGIPLGARSAGRYRVPSAFREDTQPRHFIQIFWGVAGRGTLRFDRDDCLLRPGDVAICVPGMEHRLRARSESWEYRWWTMDGPMSTTLLSAMDLAPDIYPVGPAPTALFDALTAALKDLSFAGERRAGALAYALLSEIKARRPTVSGNLLAERAIAIICRRWSEPGFGVNTLAAALGTHRSTLAREFKAAQGLNPSQFIARFRAQNALALLKASTQPVSEIAARCGYADANYFSRVIRRHSGLSPMEFRHR